MQKRFFRTSLMGLAIGFLFCAHCNLEKSPSLQLYTDPQFGFRVAYPDSGWILTDETGITEVLLAIKSEEMVADFIPNVTVAIDFLPGMMTAQEYGEKNLSSLTDQGYEILKHQKTIINGNVFYDLRCIYRNSTPPLRFQHLCLVKDRVGFIITCTAPEEQYTAFEDDFELIVTSFRFL